MPAIEVFAGRSGKCGGQRRMAPAFVALRGPAAFEASTIIWATGYRPDFSWIKGLEVDGSGHPFHDRGISTQVPGLGFLGLPFQYGLTSGIIGGAGRDARYLARRLPHHAATVSTRGSDSGANELAPDRD